MTITAHHPDMADHAGGMPPREPVEESPAVLVVGDHAPLFARSLAFALGLLGLDVQWRDGGSASPVGLAERIRLENIEVVVVDLVDQGDGTSLVDAAHDAGARVLVLAPDPDDNLEAGFLRGGAEAVLGKARPFDELANALFSGIVRGRPPSSRRRAAGAAGNGHPVPPSLDQLRSLSPRERDVLRWLMSGRTVDRIATETGLSIATVRSHVRAILAKLSVSCQLAAVALAYGAGWSAKD